MRNFKVRVCRPKVAPYSYICAAKSAADALQRAIDRFGIGTRISVRAA